MNCDKVGDYNDEKESTKSDEGNNEEQTNRADIGLVPMDTKAMNGKNGDELAYPDGKELPKETKLVTKEPPRLSQDEHVDDDSKTKGGKCPESNQPAQEETKFDTLLSSSFVSASRDLLSRDKSEPADKQKNATKSSYPLDGLWRLSWKTFSGQTTTFDVTKHTFDLFGHPCEVMLVGPEDNCCPSFQWPVAVTSKHTPVFQQSKLAISYGAETPTTIEWTTNDPQYGEITWTRVGATEDKAEAPGNESNETTEVYPLVPLYPLDGNWKMTWKSYPAEPTTFAIHNHRFKLFDCPCKIQLGNADNNYCPSFPWPEAVTSAENRIFQKSKVSFRPGLKIMELPTKIEWTTADSGYGEITWTRLNFASKKVSDSRGQKRKYDFPEIHYVEDYDYETIKLRKDLEEFRMKSSTVGKAWDLVEGAQALQTADFKAIARDDIIFLAERFLDAQKDFKHRNVPYLVDIAYHHTRSENLQTIRTDGLLTHSERQSRNIHSHYNGSVYGDGIYASLDPTKHANQRYGDTTILLARMRGKESPDRYSTDEKNTLIVPSSNFFVLQCSNQCIPLFQFEAKRLVGHCRFNRSRDTEEFLRKLADFQKQVQTLLDKIFNENIPSEVGVSWSTPTHVIPAYASSTPPVATPLTNHITVAQIEKMSSIPELRRIIRENKFPLQVIAARKRLTTIAPGILPRATQASNTFFSLLDAFRSTHGVMGQSSTYPDITPDFVSYTAPDSLAEMESEDFCRPVLTHKQLVAGCSHFSCIDPLRGKGKVVQIANCGHIFHHQCIKASMEESPCCPVCHVPISRKHWRGKMPSGIMTIYPVSTSCAGFEAHRSIAINYHIPGGKQKKYHPNPGQPFYPANYTAILANSSGGRDLLKRLKYAFSRGLTFSIGTCFNTGLSDSVIWRLTHATDHKNGTVNGTVFSPLYMIKSNQELNRFNVPSAAEITLPNALMSTSNLAQSQGIPMATPTNPFKQQQSQDAVANGLGTSALPSLLPPPRPNILSTPITQSKPHGILKPPPPPPPRPSYAGTSVTGTNASSASASSNNANSSTGNAGSIPGLLHALAGGWQSDFDYPERRKIIRSIVEILIEKKYTNASQLSQNLPETAKILEEHMYRSALTKEEYLEQKTLSDRLAKRVKILYPDAASMVLLSSSKI
jgi:hypothetical protein